MEATRALTTRVGCTLDKAVSIVRFRKPEDEHMIEDFIISMTGANKARCAYFLANSNGTRRDERVKCYVYDDGQTNVNGNISWRYEVEFAVCDVPVEDDSFFLKLEKGDRVKYEETNTHHTKKRGEVTSIDNSKYVSVRGNVESQDVRMNIHERGVRHFQYSVRLDLSEEAILNLWRRLDDIACRTKDEGLRNTLRQFHAVSPLKTQRKSPETNTTEESFSTSPERDGTQANSNHYLAMISNGFKKTTRGVQALATGKRVSSKNMKWLLRNVCEYLLRDDERETHKKARDVLCNALKVGPEDMWILDISYDEILILMRREDGRFKQIRSTITLFEEMWMDAHFAINDDPTEWMGLDRALNASKNDPEDYLARLQQCLNYALKVCGLPRIGRSLVGDFLFFSCF